MSTTTSSPGGATAEWPEGQTPYDRATLGFKNYWYPICLAKEVGKRPVTIAMLGEQLALFRRGDKVFALRDECAHRGIPPLSRQERVSRNQHHRLPVPRVGLRPRRRPVRGRAHRRALTPR